MSRPLIVLVAEAAVAGVIIGRGEHDSLTVRAPREAAPFARLLRSREVAILGLFDWRHAAVGDLQPCLICHRPAMLCDPVEARPAHKVCVDALIRPTRESR